MPTRILFFLSCHRLGTTGLLTAQATAFSRQAELRLHGVTGEGEQFAGLRRELEAAGIPFTVIPGLDEHADFGRLRRALAAVIDREAPEVIHVATNWQLALVTACRAGRCFRVVYTIHGYRHNRPIAGTVFRLALACALRVLTDRVIAPSSYVRDRFGPVRGRTSLLFLGVDPGLVDGIGPARDFDGVREFLFAGEFRAGKNQDLLIRAFARYGRETGDVDCRLHLPGEGPYRESCVALARELGVSDRVTFPGFLQRDAMRDLLRRCAFTVVPTNVETFGLAIAEGLACGRVVLTRPVGVAPDLIREGETGFFFRDETELVALLRSLLADPERCRQVAARAHALRDRLRWDTIGREYVRIVSQST